MSTIAESLVQLFDKHRVLFWYDEKHEMEESFQELDLPDVEKRIIDNNEFALKYEVLKLAQDKKYLLYQNGAKPADLDNWLLDMVLSNFEFKADQVSLYLAELEISYDFYELLKRHQEFLKSDKRKQSLKRFLNGKDNEKSLIVKMMAVCTGADAREDAILESLLQELADDKDEKWNLLVRCKLDDVFWTWIKQNFHYQSATPSIKDFAIELFKSGHHHILNEPFALNDEAYIFLTRWKDSLKHQEAFNTLSTQYAELLSIEKNIASRDFRTLMRHDLFEVIDKKILVDVISQLTQESIHFQDIQELIDHRKQGHWFSNYTKVYDALENAALLIFESKQVTFDVVSFEDGIHKYAKTWHYLDQYYRKFIAAVTSSKQYTILEKLAEKIESQYVNEYLFTLSVEWQKIVDGLSDWKTNFYSPMSQKQFFNKVVQEEYLDKNKKVVVIISDALRYEVGDELLSTIRQEDRYEGSIHPFVAMLPSYTQLGMATLLPHSKLEISNNEQFTVACDDMNSSGLANRQKILSKRLNDRAKAILANEVMSLNKDEKRQLFRDHDVIYIYHNRIDSIGDKKDSEQRVCEEADTTIVELVDIIKIMTSANATNIIVTADHGFLYQHKELDSSDFSVTAPDGDIVCRDRRFIAGKNLKNKPEFKTFSALQLGLSGDLEFQFPKSINRLRLQGSGSRYVHGGTSLQEIVIPVIKINKRKTSDLAVVDVDILRGSSNTISSGQIAVTFYQKDSVSEKVQPRLLKVGLFSKSGELISNQISLEFNSESDMPREREKIGQFVLSKSAEAFNGQEVYLRLSEPVSGTSQHQLYKDESYIIRRSFASDFDF